MIRKWMRGLCGSRSMYLAVMGTGCQKPFLDQMPHEYGCQANQGEAREKEDSRTQAGEPKSNQGLQYGPVNDIYAIREIPAFREVPEVPPEAEDKNQPGYPKNVEDITREKVINKKEACREQGN